MVAHVLSLLSPIWKTWLKLLAWAWHSGVLHSYLGGEQTDGRFLFSLSLPTFLTLSSKINKNIFHAKKRKRIIIMLPSMNGNVPLNLVDLLKKHWNSDYLSWPRDLLPFFPETGSYKKQQNKHKRLWFLTVARHFPIFFHHCFATIFSSMLVTAWENCCLSSLSNVLFSNKLSFCSFRPLDISGNFKTLCHFQEYSDASENLALEMMSLPQTLQSIQIISSFLGFRLRLGLLLWWLWDQKENIRVRKPWSYLRILA